MAGRKNVFLWSGIAIVLVGLALTWSGLTSLSQSRDDDGYLHE